MFQEQAYTGTHHFGEGSGIWSVMTKESHCQSLCHTAPSKLLQKFLPLSYCSRELGSFTSHHLSGEEDVTTHIEQTQTEVTQKDRDFEGGSLVVEGLQPELVVGADLCSSTPVKSFHRAAKLLPVLLLHFTIMTLEKIIKTWVDCIIAAADVNWSGAELKNAAEVGSPGACDDLVQSHSNVWIADTEAVDEVGGRDPTIATVRECCHEEEIEAMNNSEAMVEDDNTHPTIDESPGETTYTTSAVASANFVELKLIDQRKSDNTCRSVELYLDKFKASMNSKRVCSVLEDKRDLWPGHLDSLASGLAPTFLKGKIAATLKDLPPKWQKNGFCQAETTPQLNQQSDDEIKKDAGSTDLTASGPDRKRSCPTHRSPRGAFMEKQQSRSCHVPSIYQSVSPSPEKQCLTTKQQKRLKKRRQKKQEEHKGKQCSYCVPSTGESATSPRPERQCLTAKQQKKRNKRGKKNQKKQKRKQCSTSTHYSQPQSSKSNEPSDSEKAVTKSHSSSSSRSGKGGPISVPLSDWSESPRPEKQRLTKKQNKSRQKKCTEEKKQRSVFSDSNQSYSSGNDAPSDSEQTSLKNVSSSSSNTGARSSSQHSKKKGTLSQNGGGAIGGGASGSGSGDDDDNGSSQGRKEQSRPSSRTKEEEKKSNPSKAESQLYLQDFVYVTEQVPEDVRSKAADQPRSHWNSKPPPNSQALGGGVSTTKTEGSEPAASNDSPAMGYARVHSLAMGKSNQDSGYQSKATSQPNTAVQTGLVGHTAMRPKISADMEPPWCSTPTANKIHTGGHADDELEVITTNSPPVDEAQAMVGHHSPPLPVVDQHGLDDFEYLDQTNYHEYQHVSLSKVPPTPFTAPSGKDPVQLPPEVANDNDNGLHNEVRPIEDHGDQPPALAEMVVSASILPQQVNPRPPLQEESPVPAIEDYLVVLTTASSLDSQLAIDGCYLWSFTALVDTFTAEIKDVMPLGSELDVEVGREDF